jgi:uncharacterized repeat protein (TIGR01451 family)
MYGHGPGRPWRRSAAWVAAAVLGAMVSPSLPAVADDSLAGGSLVLREAFDGSSVADSRVRALGAACLTGAAPGAVPPDGGSDLTGCQRTLGAPPSGVVPGYAQLTDESTNQAGAIALDRAVPASAGLVLEFDQYQYGTRGTPGDGIGVILVDGAYDLDSVGGTGGSLGYAQLGYADRPGVSAPGVSGGVLGLGLDVFGNFANDNEARGTGCLAPSPYSEPVANAVSLRGPGSGEEGYCWLATRTMPTTERLDVVTADPAEARRSVRVTIGTEAHPSVTVEIDFTGTRGHYEPVLTHVLDEPLPETVKVAFAASNGAFTNVHLVGDVEIHTVEPLDPLHLVVRVAHVDGLPDRFRTGSPVPFDLVVTNSDAEPLTDVQVHVPLAGLGTACELPVLGPAGSATASATCRAWVVVGAEHARAGELLNAATATAIGTDGPLAAADTVRVPVAGSPALALTTAAAVDAGHDGLVTVGDVVRLTYEVRNTGDVDVHDVVVQEELGPTVTCDATTIAPGAVVACTGTPYPLGPEDLAAGHVTSTATVDGRVPAHADPLVPGTSTWVVPVVPAIAGLRVEQHATRVDGGTDGLADVGDVHRYAFTVTNDGHLPLVGLGVEHPLTGPVSCDSDALDRDESTGCTADVDHVVTEDDLVAGGVASEVRATARTGAGAEVVATSTLTTPTRAAVAGIDVVMSGTVDEVAPEGDDGTVRMLVRYAFRVTSTGTVSVDDVRVTDLRVAGAPWSGVTCDATRLAPGEVAACTADELYAATDADHETGTVLASATAWAQSPAGVAAVTPVHVETGVVMPETTEPEPAPVPEPGPEPGPEPEPGQTGPGGEAGGAGAGATGTDGAGLARTGSSLAAALAVAGCLLAAGVLAVRGRQAGSTDPSR